jgi:hypothetical protein
VQSIRAGIWTGSGYGVGAKTPAILLYTQEQMNSPLFNQWDDNLTGFLGVSYCLSKATFAGQRG